MSGRLEAGEVTWRRVYEAAVRRVREVPHALAWHAPTGMTRENRRRLAEFRGRHAGQRCFIIGNGPSLNRMDLSRLKEEVSFGLNRVYLLFERIPFVPTYFVCVNELVLDQFAGEMRGLRIPKFLNWNRRKHFDRRDETAAFVKLRLGLSDGFEGEATRPLFSGGTVTYAALQIAYYMGFEEVILIGVDHNFAEKGTPNETRMRVTERDESHFHAEYFPRGSRWQLPDLRRSEAAYALARAAFERDGRRILDATVEGKCPVFEKVRYEELF